MAACNGNARTRAVLMLLLSFSLPAAAAEPIPLKAEEIVARLMTNNAARAARLRSYRSARVPSDRHARMVVNAVYENGQKNSPSWPRKDQSCCSIAC
jgi:hypothetical protein